MYAYGENQLDNVERRKGRLDASIKEVSQMKGKCFFPNRLSGGRMEKKADKNGILYILAFDNDYSDNSGSYEVAFRIER